MNQKDPLLTPPGSELNWHHTSPLFPLVFPFPFFASVWVVLFSGAGSQPEGILYLLHAYRKVLDKISIFAFNPLLSIGVVALTVYLLVALISCWFWYFMRYGVDQNCFYFRKGVIFYKHREIPLSKIQSIETKATLMARILGLRSLHIESAGGNDSTVLVPYLSKQKATELYELLQELSTREKSAGAKLEVAKTRLELNVQTQNSQEQNAQEVSLGSQGFEQTTQELFSGSQELAQVKEPGDIRSYPARARGRKLVSSGKISSGIFYRVRNGLIVLSYLIRLRNVFLLLLGLVQIYIAVFALLIQRKSIGDIFLVVGIIVAMGIYSAVIAPVLAHWNTNICLRDEHLHSERGLLTKVTQSTELGRIHAFTLAQSLLWRLGNWWSMRLLIVGRNVFSSDKETNDLIMPIGTLPEAKEIIYRAMPSFQMPLLPLLQELAEGEPERFFASTWNESSAVLLDNRYQKVRSWITVPKSKRWLSPLDGRYEGLGITDNYCIRRSGFFTRRLVCLPLHHAQEITIKRGPIDRLFATASIVIYPVIGRIAPIHMSWIPLETAVKLREEIQVLMWANLRSVSASRLASAYEEDLEAEQRI